MQAFQRTHAMLLKAFGDLGARFMNVDMYRQVQLRRQRGDLLEMPVVTVYGACGAMQKEISGSSRRASRVASPLLR